MGVLLLCCFVNYWPWSLYDRTHLYHSEEDPILQNDASYGRMVRRIHNAYTDEIEHVYSAEEIRFVNEAIELIPSDALVINSPRDGSMWSYAINHLNAYYRKQSPSGETNESVLIRRNLNKISKSQKVREAVRSTGAAYVLLLDKDVAYEDGVWLDQFHKKYEGLWKGIDSLDDNTPGFEVVLAKGDQMRLYRIVV